MSCDWSSWFVQNRSLMLAFALASWSLRLPYCKAAATRLTQPGVWVEHGWIMVELWVWNIYIYIHKDIYPSTGRNKSMSLRHGKLSQIQPVNPIFFYPIAYSSIVVISCHFTTASDDVWLLRGHIVTWGRACKLLPSVPKVGADSSREGHPGGKSRIWHSCYSVVEKYLEKVKEIS